MKIHQLLTLGALAAPLGMLASEPLTLSFQRSGTAIEDVAISASIEGVSATLTSLSHSLKNVNNEILCADVNGSSSPTIVYNFTITGIPAGWTFNNVGLDIHALNMSGGNQQSTDGKIRDYNVSVTSEGTQLVNYTDLDPAAGIEGVRKVWDAQTATTVTPVNPYHLTITVTKGTENAGCFFGLQGITLSTTEGGETPEPGPEPTKNKVYNIKWKNNTSSYMAEMNAGAIQITNYSVFSKIFWEFIPTENEDCYYIRNTASGKYIGSCNMAPSSASIVKMSDTPVEYYVHLSAATSGENSGCYWLSSTDCANYDKEASSARCLNKDGASSNIITWSTSVNNVGSYWTLVEVEDQYEAKPFTTETNYLIINPAGQALNHDMGWQTADIKNEALNWIFRGESNTAGGYQIINTASGEAINSGAQYKVQSTAGAAPYNFVGANGELLTLGSEQAFTFTPARTAFAVSHQIYQLPCGSATDTWISQVIIGTEYHYPMATRSNNSLIYSAVTSKPGKYVMLTRDAAPVHPGEAVEMTVTLNKAPGAEYKLTAFIDFDRDGIFETAKELSTAQTQTVSIDIPDDARTGRTRMRLRLSNNGLSGADDDVSGEVLDLLLNVSEASAELIEPQVTVNDPKRGTAVWDNGMATATRSGNAMFLYWAEGNRISSTDSQYEVAAANTPRKLTAFFSANTEVLTGIDEALLDRVDSSAVISYNDSMISVEGGEAQLIILFAVNGKCVSAANARALSTTGVPAGIYIVKAITDNGVVSAKIKI